MSKKTFKNFIHLMYLTGIVYAFYFYVTTPKSTSFYHRRLWAMETWFLITLYGFFLWVMMLTDKDDNFELNARGVLRMMKLREKKAFYFFLIVAALFSIRFIGRV